jgi:hypothetical protein
MELTLNTRQMLEKRSQLAAQLRALQDDADATSDDGMTPEQTAAFDALRRETFIGCALSMVREVPRQLSLALMAD